ncbi:MAG: cystathionine beta-synthase, partial [Pseudomonadota bacterium]
MSDYRDTLKNTIAALPSDWLRLTTHRLDIYTEKLAKVEFIEKFEGLSDYSPSELSELPTAFDYIRLGHPLSCVLEWAIAKETGSETDRVVSFASQTMPLLAVLRKNKFLNKRTRIVAEASFRDRFDVAVARDIYGYDFVIEEDSANLQEFDGSTVVIGNINAKADFRIRLYQNRGSVIIVEDDDPEYIKEILHVRRRESIAMTPQDCLQVLNQIVGNVVEPIEEVDSSNLESTIQEIAKTEVPVSLGSSGLSVQYAIMMGLIHYADQNHNGKKIQFIVPPNCYGGTNDQARRVAACLDHVEIVDLPVDSGKDMVKELERILNEAASTNSVPYIIAEIPTNPRVEIPDLNALRETLNKKRTAHGGGEAIAPVFILDQTFCPNVVFFGQTGYLHDVSTISYVSGSKFPSGGLCNSGYAAANTLAKQYMPFVDRHLKVCDNRATY